MKVALVHDFLKEYGGAERVVETLHEIYPDAPIYTAFVDYEGLGPHAERIRHWLIKTTWAQSIPFISKLYSPLRFLAPFFFRSLDLSDYDVIISSTNAYYAKGIVTRPRQIHICYCHTPPRSLYGYKTAMDWKKNWLVRVYGTIINHFLRIYDFKAAQHVDYFIANSKEVQRRIEKFYRRDSTVIYPPVELIDGRSLINHQHSTFKNLSSTFHHLPSKGYYLYVGKLAFAKHVDLAIAAANKLKIPLKIVGKGAEEVKLRSIAGPTVEFLGEVSDEQLYKLYAQCRAVIFPAEDEDFGIVPVEAIAAGVPVIAHRSGGVIETVIDQKTGVFFPELTVESLIDAIKKLSNLEIKKADCIKQAQKFSKDRFMKEIKVFVVKVGKR